MRNTNKDDAVTKVDTEMNGEGKVKAKMLLAMLIAKCLSLLPSPLI